MWKLIRIIIIAALVFPLSFLYNFDAHQDASPATAPNTDAHLRFTSGGHVLGFGSSSVYMAGLDHTIHIEFVDSRPVQPIAEGPAALQNGIAPLGKIIYRGAWENIDVIYSSAVGGIAESTYVIHPGGNPAHISLRYNMPLSLEQDGALRLSFANGYMEEAAPVAWQETDGRRSPVEVSFRRQDESRIGFALGSHDSSRTVYIDPTYQWHTFYGPQTIGRIGAKSIALDSAGNIYIAGYSERTWNGPTGQAPLHAYTGGITILKLNSSGAYQWHTFYGSKSRDSAVSIALDSGGNIYMAGNSTATWNGSDGQAPLHAYTGGITILKLNSSGAYLWHTFYGSTTYDSADSIALDSAGNIYMAGNSRATWDGPAGQAPLHAYTGGITILKLNSSGAYLWHTFYGMDSGARALALDSSCNIYIAGYSAYHNWYGPDGQPPLHAYHWQNDMVILKLNSSGAYLWHTFYGSDGNEDANAIALDSAGNVYVGGDGEDWNGPDGEPPLHAFTYGYYDWDIAILKLNSSGAYLWHTFYGSSNWDYVYSIAPDSCSNVYVAGYSFDTWNGPNGEPPLYAYTKGMAALKLNSSGAYRWHTFYGVSYNEKAYSIAPDSSGNVYIAGVSQATWNGPAGQAPLNSYTRMNDITLIKMQDFATPVIDSFNPASGSPGTSVTISGSGFTCATAVSFGGTAASSFTVDSDTRITAIAGQGSTGKITVTNPAGTATSASDFTFSLPLPVIDSFNPASGGPGTSVIISGRNFTGITAVRFGGTAAAGFTVDSDTRITATLGQGSTGRITVTAPGGTAASASDFTFETQQQLINAGLSPHGSPAPGTPASQSPISLPVIQVQSASLSASSVTPGTSVTVTATAVNKGTANGSSRITLYVNGQEESSRGVTIESGQAAPLTFTVSRNEPGTYRVYVNGTQAGSFSVSDYNPNTILYISSALLLIALIGGLVFFTRRR